jgi:hypothetical protein
VTTPGWRLLPENVTHPLRLMNIIGDASAGCVEINYVNLSSIS